MFSVIFVAKRDNSITDVLFCRNWDLFQLFKNTFYTTTKSLYLKTYLMYPYFHLFLLLHSWTAVQWYLIQRCAVKFYVQQFEGVLSKQEILVGKQSIFLEAKPKSC